MGRILRLARAFVENLLVNSIGRERQFPDSTPGRTERCVAIRLAGSRFDKG
jgi:hypothetical protein